MKRSGVGGVAGRPGRLKLIGSTGTLGVGSRAPHGARGLKQVQNDPQHQHARGLKHPDERMEVGIPASRPAWGAWIETFLGLL